jgi:ankyrin repeat protein
MWENKMASRIFTMIGVISILLTNCAEPKNSYKQRLAEMGIEFNEKNFADSIIQGNIETVRLFLSAGMSAHEKNDGLPPLLEASRRGHSEVALALIEAGADVNARDAYGVTAMMFAAICGSAEVIERLIDEGADVNAQDLNGRSVLIEALTTENDIPVSTIQSLVEAGAAPNVRINGGVTPLMLAATGDPEVLQILIDAGADVNAQDDHGATALMRAAHKPENVSILNAAGAKE